MRRAKSAKAAKTIKAYILALIGLLLASYAAILVMQWVRAHPEHFSGRQLELAHPIGWATPAKLVALAEDDAACFRMMEGAGLSYDRWPVEGEGQCRASQRMILNASAPFPALKPARAAPGCAMTAALLLWHRDIVSPEAEALFGQKVVRLENLGSYNCRNVRGGGSPSQHSRANAMDISAFILADGSRISVKDHWADEGLKGAFLHAVRDGACELFTTSLSPDYNSAHADHFHFDLASRAANWRVCR